LIQVIQADRFHLDHTAVALAHLYAEDAAYPIITDWVMNPEGLRINVKDFLNLLHNHTYYVKFHTMEERNCTNITIGLRFLERHNGKWVTLSKIDLNPFNLTPSCYMRLGARSMFDLAIEKYGEELAFYKLYSSKHIFARFNIEINGLPPGEEVVVYRLFGNDTHINEAGIASINHHSEEVYPQSQFIENYKLLHYQYITDITGLQFFAPTVDSQFGFQTLGVDSMEKIYIYPPDQLSVHFSVLENAEYYLRYTDNILMVLSKIGGLLAFLKISFALGILHRSNAEKEI
jgi:hypothetical protein